MKLLIIAISLALAATSCSRPPQPKMSDVAKDKPAAPASR